MLATRGAGRHQVAHRSALALQPAFPAVGRSPRKRPAKPKARAVRHSNPGLEPRSLALQARNLAFEAKSIATTRSRTSTARSGTSAVMPQCLKPGQKSISREAGEPEISHKNPCARGVFPCARRNLLRRRGSTLHGSGSKSGRPAVAARGPRSQPCGCSDRVAAPREARRCEACCPEVKEEAVAPAAAGDGAGGHGGQQASHRRAPTTLSAWIAWIARITARKSHKPRQTPGT